MSPGFFFFFFTVLFFYWVATSDIDTSWMPGAATRPSPASLHASDRNTVCSYWQQYRKLLAQKNSHELTIQSLETSSCRLSAWHRVWKGNFVIDWFCWKPWCKDRYTATLSDFIDYFIVSIDKYLACSAILALSKPRLGCVKSTGLHIWTDGGNVNV